MEDTTKVTDLLEELEDVIENASTIPLSSRVVVEPGDIFSIIKEIQLALPDDIQQAKWIREERDRILEDAKAEYERIIKEAQKQADYLVESDEITRRATQTANKMMSDTTANCKMLKMKTYDYVDKILYDMQGKMDTLNMKYFGEMYTSLEQTFTGIAETLNANREEMRNLAFQTQNEEE